MKSRGAHRQLLTRQMGYASAVLVIVLSLSFLLVFYVARDSIKQNCFKTLEEATVEVSASLRNSVEKDRQQLVSFATFIEKQDDIQSGEILELLQSFNGEGIITELNLLLPDDTVLSVTGERINAAGVLSFKIENASGVHLSDISVSLDDPNKNVVRLFVPIKKDDETIALIYGTIELERISELYEVNAYGGNVEMYLVDVNTGDFLLDTWQNSLGNVNLLKDREIVDGGKSDEIINSILSGQSGQFAFVSENSNEVYYMHYKPTGINNWQTLLSVPSNTVFEDAEFPLRMLFWLAVVYFFSFTVYILWCVRCYHFLVRLFIDIPSGVGILSAGKNNSIQIANEKFYNILNITDKGKSDKGLVELLDSSVAERLTEQWQKMKRNRETQAQHEIDLKNGKSVFVSTYYDKKQNSYTVTVFDITGRKRMEQDLRVLEQEYKIAVRLSDCSVLIYKIEERTLNLLPDVKNLLNIEKTTLHVPEDLYLDGMFTNESRVICQHLIADIVSGKKSGGAYLQIKPKKDNDFRWFRADFYTIFDAAGMPMHAVISIFDATDQHENELAYRKMQQEDSKVSEDMYKSFEYDLTTDTVEKVSGSAFSLPKSVKIFASVEDHAKQENAVVSPEYMDAFLTFIDRERLISIYNQKIVSDAMEFKISTGRDETLWFDAHLQLLEDSFSGDLNAYFHFSNIDAEKSQRLKTELDVKSLRKQLENSRIRIMMNQMQPHFLYNALSAIQIIIKTDPDYAYRLVYDFTVHLRASIRALQSDDCIPFSDELKNIKAYLNIEKMRFGEKFNVEYNIECEDFMVVPLTIQPLAENAARHGVFPKGKAGGTIIIHSYETDDHYIVEVIDDGNGFDVNKVLKAESGSVGLNNLIFRLITLMDAEVGINSRIGVGTTVTVRIPKQKGGK